MIDFLYGAHLRALLASSVLAVILLLTQAPAAGASQHSVSNDRHAINLASNLVPIEPKSLPPLKAFEKYRLYTTRHRERGRNWYRLRLGFFPDASSAARVMKTLRQHYPDAWVTRVTDAEWSNSKGGGIRSAPVSRPDKVKPGKPAVAKKRGAAKAALPEKSKSLKSGMTDKRLGSIMESAEAAMTGGKYRLAAQLYTKVLEYQGNKFSQEARELLGLAYERSKRLAHAKAEYRTYLMLYPKGEGAKRVRQRLAGLETARAKPKKKLRVKKEVKETYEVYGSFSQFYNRDESYTDVGGNVVTASTVSNDFDINIRKRTAAYEVNGVLIAGYELDMLHASESESRLSRLYVDMLDRRLHLSARLGRQSRSTGGVLGRFDGALVSYQYFQRIKFNVVAGYPLETSKLNGIHTDKYFYGVSVDIGTIADSWDFNAFFIDQYNAGVTDRRAVGAEVRYYEPGRSLFSLIDYDISYNDLNTLLLVGNWRFENQTMINTSFDYRKSPTISTANAFFGQTASGSFSEMLETLSEDEVRSLAEDRTATSRSFMIGATRPLNQKVQISGDFTVSELTGTPASGGVEAGVGTGYEYFYNVQLIGSGLIKPTDTAIAGLRYSDTSISDTISLNLNSRYPINRSVRINPRLRFDMSKVHSNSAKEIKIRPSLRADYYWKRDFRFEFEGGMELAYERVSDQTNKTTDYFLRMGYRAEF